MNQQAIILAGSTAVARVAGLSLVKRLLLALSRAGVTQAQVVSTLAGDAASRSMREELKHDVEDVEVMRTGLRVSLVEADGEVAGVRAAAQKLDGPALVLRGDRVFDVGLLKRGVQAEGAVAFVDRKAPGQIVGAWTVPAGALATLAEGPDNDINAALTALTATTLETGDNLWALADAPDLAQAGRGARSTSRSANPSTGQCRATSTGRCLCR